MDWSSYYSYVYQLKSQEEGIGDLPGKGVNMNIGTKAEKHKK